MDFHTLSRRELQVLCKKNKIPANMTNVAMADALAALQHVEGLEEFINPSEPTVLMQSPEKAPTETPGVLQTATRASARSKPKEPHSSQVVCHARRSTMSSIHAAVDQENKQVNLPDTPAVPTTRKRAGLASAQRRSEAMKRDDKNEEGNRDVPKSSTVKSTQRKARASAAPRIHSTRRSVRLLEKSISELKLSGDRASELEPIKMNDLGLKEESEEVLEENEENESTLDANCQAAQKESLEKPDSSVSVEKSTGMEEKEREPQCDVNANVESSCVGALGSEVIPEAECDKSDCVDAISDSDLKDDFIDENSDQQDGSLLVSDSDLKDDVIDEKSDQLDDNLLVLTLNQDVPPVDISTVQTDGHNAFAEIEDQEHSQSDDVDVNADVEVKGETEEKLLPNENIQDNEEDGNNGETDENGLKSPLLPEEQNSPQQMVENNEGVLISETISSTSDDLDKLVPHIASNSDRLVPRCDDIHEPVGNNDSGVEISMSSPLEFQDRESIKLDQLVEVNVIESEEFATEVAEWHKSMVETSLAAKSSEVNVPNIQEYADIQELVDVHVVSEVEFVEGARDSPPSAIADKKTPISKSSTRSPLAVNVKVAVSPLTADRLPQFPVLVKSSSKKQSTVRKMANKLDNNKENMDIPLSPSAEGLLLELPRQVNSSNKKQSALRRVTTLLGDDKENMQKSGRKVEPHTEKAKKRSEEGKITDGDRVLESLRKKSLRQLRKIIKEKLEVTETERQKDNTTEQQQLGSARPALRVLSENQMALGEVEGN